MAIDMSTKALKNISNYVKGRAVHNAGTRSQTTLLVINTVPLGLKLIASPRCANRHENCTADPSSNKRMYLSSTGLRLERVIWRTTRRQVLFSDDWPATSWSYDRTMETFLPSYLHRPISIEGFTRWHHFGWAARHVVVRVRRLNSRVTTFPNVLWGQCLGGIHRVGAGGGGRS